mmetsp:Transcript_56275/g.150632  ORF Transcript_56275/g.150632 Transcript_56275/m.150632 type:complete len:203 (-) Transcript_56275:376-984(-)
MWTMLPGLLRRLLHGSVWRTRLWLRLRRQLDLARWAVSRLQRPVLQLLLRLQRPVLQLLFVHPEVLDVPAARAAVPPLPKASCQHVGWPNRAPDSGDASRQRTSLRRWQPHHRLPRLALVWWNQRLARRRRLAPENQHLPSGGAYCRSTAGGRSCAEPDGSAAACSGQHQQHPGPPPQPHLGSQPHQEQAHRAVGHAARQGS